MAAPLLSTSQHCGKFYGVPSAFFGRCSYSIIAIANHSFFTYQFSPSVPKFPNTEDGRISLLRDISSNLIGDVHAQDVSQQWRDLANRIFDILSVSCRISWSIIGLICLACFISPSLAPLSPLSLTSSLTHTLSAPTPSRLQENAAALCNVGEARVCRGGSGARNTQTRTSDLDVSFLVSPLSSVLFSSFSTCLFRLFRAYPLAFLHPPCFLHFT